HSASGTQWQPMQWAFGSGTMGMTPVGRSEGRDYVEAPVSYYRNAGWDFTVGFLGRAPELRQQQPTGTPMTDAEAFACFDCHVTGRRRPGTGLDLDGARPGVRCERCHGPGAAHIAAARAGHPPSAIILPGGGSASAMVDFCATCHRSAAPTGLKETD